MASDRLRAGARAFSTWMPPRFGGVGLPPPGYPTTNRATEERVSGRDALEGRIAVDAGPILDRYSTYAATQLDPVKIESILKQADLGVVSGGTNCLTEGQRTCVPGKYDGPHCCGTDSGNKQALCIHRPPGNRTIGAVPVLE